MRGLAGTRPKSLSRQPGREAAKTAGHVRFTLAPFRHLPVDFLRAYDRGEEHKLPQSVEDVPLSQIRWANQGAVEKPTLDSYVHNPPSEEERGLPEMLKVPGGYHLNDGHTRAQAAHLRGEQTIKSVVYHPPKGKWDYESPRGDLDYDDWELPGLEDHKTAAARWFPSSGVFGPTTGYDPVLFGEKHELRPEVRRDIMERLDQALRVDTGLAGSDWQDWTKVYIAGGSASEWAGGRPNDTAQDLDVLIGVNYPEAKRGSLAMQDMDSSQIDTAFNVALRNAFNESGWQPEFGGTWDLTGYVNPDAYDITKIKPYAAYNVTDMKWAVKPPHLPEHTVADFDPAVIQIARAVAAEARAILRLPEPVRTREARALWERLHAERRMAFSDQGEGWQDVGNLVEKWLAYAPRKPLEKIRELALGQPKTAAAWSGHQFFTGTADPRKLVPTENTNKNEKWSVPGSAGRKYLDEVKADIAAHGMQTPIDVDYDKRGRDRAPKPYIGQGHHRHRAAIELGLREVPVSVASAHGAPEWLNNPAEITIEEHNAHLNGFAWGKTAALADGEPDLTATDYEGRTGDPSHITRVERGWLPTSAVAHMPGARGEVPGEHTNRQGQKWEAWKAQLREEGIQNPLFITVDHGQEPRLSEGNHRRDFAVEEGLSHVPVEIRYYGHAEQQGLVHERQQHTAAADHVVLYHGTSQENADAIAQHGLEAPQGHWYPAQWPITTVNRQTADAYATRGDQHATVEIHVPKHQADEYLWPAQDHIGGAAYAPKKDLPAAWVHAVHPVTEPVDFPDDRRHTAAVEPYDDDGEPRPWHQKWPGESDEDATARRGRYIQQVAAAHGVSPAAAHKAITRVAQDVATGEPFTHARGYGFRSDPGNRDLFSPRQIQHLMRPEVWRHVPVTQVPAREIHASQPWLNPPKLAHNLFHPGKDVPVNHDETGHPDLDPDDYRGDGEDLSGIDEEAHERHPDLGEHARYMRRGDGRMVMIDGHHRAAIDMLLGKKTTPGTVIDEDAAKPGPVRLHGQEMTAQDLHSHMLQHHDRTRSELPEPRDANHLDLVDEHDHSHEFEDPGHEHEVPESAHVKGRIPAATIDKYAAADSIYVPPPLPAEALEKAKAHPHQVAASYAQMAMWHDHPRVRMQFPQSHEGGDELVGHMLTHTGYGGDTEGAFVARHPRPENKTSNAAWLNGKPGVALHPDRWEYGIVAHEAAHHAVMYHHAIGPNEPQTDEQVHGPEWSGAYAQGLNVISPHAGDDFLAHKQHYLDQIAAHHGMAKQAAFDSDVRDHGFRHVDEQMAEIPDHVHLGRLPAYDFPLSKITVASQPKVDPALVRQYRDDPPKRKKIIVRPYGEHLAVADGHHAIAAARANGETHIRARWMGDDDEDPSDYMGLEKEAAGSDGDDWVTCEQGCEHWGKHGAAGLLIRHRGDDGLYRYLLQKRAGDDEVDHGGTWSIPSGAIGKDETPEEGAVREYREEHGPLPQGVTHHHTVKSTDHGDWAFHTVVMDAPERFSPRGGGETEEEQQGAAWHTAAEVRGMKNRGELHPAFAESWDAVRRSRGPKEAQATKTQSEAAYRPATGKKRCGGCVMFREGVEHDWCTKVKGDIDEDYVCRFFYAKGKTAATGYNLSPGSGMIYLDIPPELVNHLPGGVDDHHITLVYLGKGLSDEQFEEACRRAAATAARHHPLEGVLRGIETFPPNDGKTPAFVPAYIPGIGKLRQELEDLSASQHKDYRPHVTLAYLEDGEPLPPPHPAVPLKFTHLHVKRGDDVQSFPLGEPMARQAAYRQPPTEETWQARRQRVEHWLDRQGEMMSLPHKWGPHTSNQVAHTLISDYDGPVKDEHWEHLPDQDVSLRQPIHTHQGFVYTDTVKHYLNADADPDNFHESGEYTPGGDEPKLVRHNGTHYLLDGHHRYAKDRLMGHESMVGKVFDTSNPEHKQSNCYECHRDEAEDDYDHASENCPTCQQHGWYV